MSAAAEFASWEVQPRATRLVSDRLDALCSQSRWLAEMRDRLLVQTGTRLIDWVDTIHVDASAEWEDAGFSDDDPFGVGGRVHHAGAQLPWVVPDGATKVVLRVESVVDFIRAQSIPQKPISRGSTKMDAMERSVDRAAAAELLGIDTGIVPTPQHLASRRGAVVSRCNGVIVGVVQRHGDQGSADCHDAVPIDPAVWNRHLERFRLRPRQFSNAVEGIRQTIDWVRPAVADLGPDAACDLFFQTEREYWQLRNDAAQLQLKAQASLGLGWANHDHHTYRSSRRGFAALVGLLELLGMRCRERFYAGADAGWGAQVLEQPRARIVVFADVDMSADEVLGDFAHEGLAESDGRGTVGLWCDLHGEAVLQAGMHHLECQFDFTAARERLAAAGVDSLNPFTDFEFLRQSFTRGQMWPVAPDRVSTALERGWINASQAERFLQAGATGSHLEVLERNDGYKGFNQSGISDIIARTDPRNAHMD
jgi:hypothetical protein